MNSATVIFGSGVSKEIEPVDNTLHGVPCFNRVNHRCGREVAMLGCGGVLNRVLLRVHCMIWMIIDHYIYTY